MMEGYGQPQKLCEGVYLVGGAELSDPADCLIYAVDCGGVVALIDCGVGRSVPRILHNLDLVGLGGKPVSTLVLTHGHVDHIGGTSAIVAHCHAEVVCHRGDLEAVETGDPRRTASGWYGMQLPRTRVDRVLSGSEGELIVDRVHLQWLHTPGHTPGSIALVWDSPAGRVLFAQDVHGPFVPDFESNLDHWAQSMRKLLALGPDMLCEGHYGVFRPRAVAEEFIRKQLDAQGYPAEL